MKRILLVDGNGGCRIIVPVEPMLEGESEEQYFARIKARALEADPSLALLEDKGLVLESDLPDRKYRAAWKFEGAEFKLDQSKKSEIDEKLENGDKIK